MYDDDQCLKSISGKKKDRRWLRKKMKKLKRMKQKIIKRLTSLNSPMKSTHWNDGKLARGNRPRKI